MDVRSVTGRGGAGMMVRHDLLPGAVLGFNTFHLESCESDFVPDDELLCLDYCRDGRLEQPMYDGTVAYVARGDVKVDDRSRHEGRFIFPLGRYGGVTVILHVREVMAFLDTAFPDGHPDLTLMRTRLCRDGRPLIIRDDPRLQRTFGDLVSPPAGTGGFHRRVATLELLSLLDGMRTNAVDSGRPYFDSAQVARVKAAQALMAADPAVHHTIGELAARAGLPMTTFKTCFKGVYGQSPYAYMKTLRMERAASLLRGTGMSVTDVGLTVGYDNPSKFAAAFRSVMGTTPSRYRRGT